MQQVNYNRDFFMVCIMGKVLSVVSRDFMKATDVLNAVKIYLSAIKEAPVNNRRSFC